MCVCVFVFAKKKKDQNLTLIMGATYVFYVYVYIYIPTYPGRLCKGFMTCIENKKKNVKPSQNLGKTSLGGLRRLDFKQKPHKIPVRGNLL